MPRVRPFLTALLASGMVAAGLAQSVVRTADPAKRGLRDRDFPADDQSHRQRLHLRGFHAGDEKFTTTDMFVVTEEGVLVADGQGQPRRDQRARRRDPEGHAQTNHNGRHLLRPRRSHGRQWVFSVRRALHHSPTSKAISSASPPPSCRSRGDGWTLPPTAELVGERKTFTLGGEEVQILFLAARHTGGDSQRLPPDRRSCFSADHLESRVPAMRSAIRPGLGALTRRKDGTRTSISAAMALTEAGTGLEEEIRAFTRRSFAVIVESDTGSTGRRAGGPRRFTRPTGAIRIMDARLVAGPIAISKVYEELSGRAGRRPTAFRRNGHMGPPRHTCLTRSPLLRRRKPRAAD